MIFHLYSDLLDTNDYSWTRGQLTITEDVQFQCVSIPIRSDNVRESSYEYFAFQISAASFFDGLSLEPSVARVYIIDRDCELRDFNLITQYTHTVTTCYFSSCCLLTCTDTSVLLPHSMNRILDTSISRTYIIIAVYKPDKYSIHEKIIMLVSR